MLKLCTVEFITKHKIEAPNLDATSKPPQPIHTPPSISCLCCREHLGHNRNSPIYGFTFSVPLLGSLSIITATASIFYHSLYKLMLKSFFFSHSVISCDRRLTVIRRLSHVGLNRSGRLLLCFLWRNI